MVINKCPKCGREPSVIKLFKLNNERNHLYLLKNGWEVECYDCGLHTGRCETQSEAVTKWNELTKGENK